MIFPCAFLFHSRDNSLTVRVLAHVLLGFISTVMASKAIGSSMKLMPLLAQFFSSLVEIGRDALVSGMLPLQN